MIDWVNDEGKHWGYQYRLVYLGKDGWPSRSILGKLIEEGLVGASVGRFFQYMPECLDVRALGFNLLVKALPEEQRARAFIHWVVVGKGKVKAQRMGESRSVYYDRLDATCKAIVRADYELREQERKKKSQEPDKMASMCSRPDALGYGTVLAA